ncbi:hypothetical protein CEXT_644531 [Caerostris extrusa]|uniref:Uncharacterized protein n=1 Tax=Caerostris extrusa TaxID=172846 RepID=A0AAV4R6E2_CAEEX|nr:hypothetical protein CEXT_644531 [Caerostris extrusa]
MKIQICDILKHNLPRTEKKRAVRNHILSLLKFSARVFPINEKSLALSGKAIAYCTMIESGNLISQLEEGRETKFTVDRKDISSIQTTQASPGSQNR